MPQKKCNTPTIAGLILAGGRGLRMGGCNKGLVNYLDKPLVNYAAANLTTITDKLLVCTNDNADDYRALGFDVVDDGEFAWRGPLAGMNAGFDATHSEYLAVIACDQLSLPTHIYPALLDAALACPAKSAIASDGYRIHPTCAVIHRDQQISLREHLNNNRLRTGRWFEEIGAQIVEFRDETFNNVNYREDLK